MTRLLVDPNLLEEVRKAAGVRTKRHTIELALRQLVLKRRLEDLKRLEGSEVAQMDLEELKRWREASTET